MTDYLLVAIWLLCGCGGGWALADAAHNRNGLAFLLALMVTGVGVAAGLLVLS